MYCVNGSDGEELWSISGWFEAGAPAGADGYMVAINGYDNQLYCFGKGNTETTIEAPMTGVASGSNMVIRGSVTDQSSGQTCFGKPVAGTPAISDESMSQWMEYLYMEQSKPNNATGVTVKLNVIDSNNNFRPIGEATTDASGTYSLTWQPDIPGDYTIIASFEGSNSYYSSSAETHFTADEPTTTATAVPVHDQPATEMYILGAAITIIIAVAIVGTVLFITIRKRP